MRSPAEVVVQQLIDAGSRAVFGVPGGGGNLDLIDAAGRGGLPFVLTATETGAALAAIAQAEISQRPAACLTTLGPGATSVVNGVACAYLDRAPMIVFTDVQGAGPGGGFEHQRIDQRALFSPITRWSGRLVPDRADEILTHALAAAAGPPPGPVHIDCPGEESGAMPASSLHAMADAPAAGDISRLETLTASARRPLVIVGLGARAGGDATAIRAFVERRGLPALVTYKAKGVVPDHHASFAGVFTHAQIERSLIEQSDLILAIGLDPVELLPRPWTYGQPVVYLGRWLPADNHVPFAARYISEIAEGLETIDTLLPPCDWDLGTVRQHVADGRRAIDVATDGLSAQEVVRIAAERLARDARVTVDAGAHMFPATMLWPACEPNQLLISNGLSTMGFALPAAIGAALLDRTRPVVALTGDGGLLMCAAELLTAAREKLQIIVIVFADASLSLIEIKQQRRQLTAAGVALGAVRWPAIAEGFGAAGFVAENAGELERAVEQARAVDGPSLIEARIDRSNYGRMLQAIRG